MSPASHDVTRLPHVLWDTWGRGGSLCCIPPPVPPARADGPALSTTKITPRSPGMAPTQPFGLENHVEQIKLWTHPLLSLNAWLSEVESWCHLPFTMWLSVQTKDGVLSARTLPPPSLPSSFAATCLALPAWTSHREASLSGLLNQFKYCLIGHRQEWDVKDAGCPGGHGLGALAHRVSPKLHANQEGQKPFWNS